MYYLLLSYTFLAFSLLGCSSSTQSKKESKRQVMSKAAMAKSNDFIEISLSSGGGYTGMYDGFTMFPDGRVTCWQRKPAGGESILWNTKVAQTKTARFAAQLLAIDALNKPLKKSGNALTIVSITTADSTSTWSWNTMKNDAPPELVQWYKGAAKFCRKLAQQRNNKGEER